LRGESTFRMCCDKETRADGLTTRYIRVTYRLTLGLMGLDELHLRVLATSSDDERERKNAVQGAPYTQSALEMGLSDILSPVLRLLNKGRHWVLVVSSQHFPCASILLTSGHDRSCSSGMSCVSHTDHPTSPFTWNVDRKREFAHLSGQCSEHKVHIHCYRTLNHVDWRRDRRDCYLFNYDWYGPFSLSSAHALTNSTVIFGYGALSPSRSLETYLIKVDCAPS
jgi:hypothetical protein